jgi:negative regulator of flagellin synthesis FlgM
MEQHGPTDLTGPLRGTSAWWQGTGAPPDDTGAASSDTPNKKGKGMARRRRGSRRGDGESIRPDLVERVRQEIAAGTYDSPEKWEAALDRLLDRLQRD